MESSFLNTSRSLQPTKLNLNAILYQQPLYVRCATITHQIRESSSKELHHFFPHLLSNIFGYDQTTGWCLKSLHPTAHKDNHTAVMNFLHVKGPIFELIGKLESEGYIYEFPVCHLPAPTQDAIHSGTTLPFFTIRDQDAIREGFVLLNAFEYYVCHFAYYLVHTRRVSQQWTPLVNCCYSLLVNEYLSHFLPPWDVIQPSNPPSPSPTRRVSSPVTTHQQDTASWQQCPRTPPGQHSPSSLGLLKMSSPHHRRTVGGGSMQLWKSEVFVQILIDFWLNQSQYEIASHFDVTQDEFKPSEEHCRIVRMMMKNIHYFANGGGVVQSLSCPALAGLTDNLRRSIIPLYVQSRMYCFLHHALEHWTFDVVYRYVLELWLTYIQPWRYTDPNQPQPNANGDNEKEAFHIGWRSFIAGNLPFYINLLGNFLARANQLDLQLRSEVELLARVAKVFSQRGLSDCLSEEEDARVTAYQSSLGGRPIHSSFLKHHNGCSESNGIEIAPLFTSSLDKVYTLLNAVRSARDYADQQMSRTTPRPARGASPIDVPSTPPPAAPPERKGWTTSVWKFFMDEGEYSYTAHQPRSVSPDTWRTVSSLLAATERNLCTVFQIAPAVGTESADGGMDGSPVLPRVPPVQEQEHLSLPSNFPSSSMEPEYEDVSLKLTPLGIDQIKSGLRKCAVKNVVYRGDPLLQPIRSYENPLLVRTFYQISSCLNEKFSPQLTTITSGNRFVYRLARELLAPPPPGSAPPPSREMATPTRMISAPPTSRTAPSHHRINLRPLASYYTLSYLFVVIMLLWLLNFKLVTMVILGLVCIFFYTCFKYVCRLYHKSKHH